MTAPVSNVRRMVRLLDHVMAEQVKEPEWTAAYSLDRQIAQARREMGEQKWKQLMAEWE